MAGKVWGCVCANLGPAGKLASLPPYAANVLTRAGVARWHGLALMLACSAHALTCVGKNS